MQTRNQTYVPRRKTKLHRTRQHNKPPSFGVGQTKSTPRQVPIDVLKADTIKTTTPKLEIQTTIHTQSKAPPFPPPSGMLATELCRGALCLARVRVPLPPPLIPCFLAAAEDR